MKLQNVLEAAAKAKKAAKSSVGYIAYFNYSDGDGGELDNVYGYHVFANNADSEECFTSLTASSESSDEFVVRETMHDNKVVVIFGDWKAEEEVDETMFICAGKSKAAAKAAAKKLFEAGDISIQGYDDVDEFLEELIIEKCEYYIGTPVLN